MMIKQGKEGEEGKSHRNSWGGGRRATEMPPWGGRGDKSHKNTSLEYSSVPGTRFTKVPVTYRAREAVLLSFRRRVERGLEMIQL